MGRSLGGHGTHVVSHRPMSHIGHREHRTRIELGNRSAQTFTGGDRARAADLLGVGYKALLSRIKELGIEAQTRG